MKALYSHVISWFEENMPVAESELNFNSPYQLIVAVMLSAQCTDKRVNMVTPALFERYPSMKALAGATPEEVFPLIRSISYPNSKAGHLCGMARMAVEKFNGEVPCKVEELITLPGVGRKTANVVASIIYNEPVIAVDTHVFRVARRIGLSDGTTPRAVELDLERNIGESIRPKAHHWRILHGRYVCVARKPKCGDCGIAPFCRFHKKSAKNPTKK